LAVVAGMKKMNDHVEPTKSQTLKKQVHVVSNIIFEIRLY